MAFAAFALNGRAAEVNGPVASGRFSGGPCQLRVSSVEQVPSADNRRGFAVRMELHLEIPPGTAPATSLLLPVDVYLDNDGSPLTAAFALPAKNLAKNPHTGWAQGKIGIVTIEDLEVGDARPRLQNVDFELVLTKITEWETKSFQSGQGTGEFLACGPFELRIYSQPHQVRVDAWAYPGFRKEHDAYRQKMPVNFLDSAYAMQELKIEDAAKHRPTSAGSSMPASGAASTTFTGWNALESTDTTAAAADGGEVVYPLSLTLRLPKRYEKERIKFHFDEIRLPAPEKPVH